MPGWEFFFFLPSYTPTHATAPPYWSCRGLSGKFNYMCKYAAVRCQHRSLGILSEVGVWTCWTSVALAMESYLL